MPGLRRDQYATFGGGVTDPVIVSMTNGSGVQATVFPSARASLVRHFTDAVAATVVNVQSSNAVHVIALRLVNTTAAVAYLQMFMSAAAAVTLGVTVPDWVIRLAANESLVFAPSVPLYFTPALSIAGTTTPTGAVGASISVGIWGSASNAP